MMMFIASRVLQGIPVVIVMSVVVFIITNVLPGDAASAALGLDASQEALSAFREEHGLNDPLPIRYLHWAGNVLTGDFGVHLRSNTPISEIIAGRAFVTLELAFVSMIIATMIGMPIGIISASRRDSWLDVGVSLVAFVAMAIPFFWLAILMILFFSVHLGWLPPSGYVPFFEQPLKHISLFAMPTVALGASLAALVARQTRTSMLQTLCQDYVRTARAKGASEYSVVVGHALPNALLPVITVISVQFAALLGGAVIAEAVFSLPGIGQMIVIGISQRDMNMVQGALVFFVVVVVIVNLATDIAYSFLDPRISA